MTPRAGQVDDEARLLRRGLHLEYTTLTWNVVGTVVCLAAALSASSIALAAFGLDSLVEILASAVVIWHLRDTAAARERPAMLTLAGAFFTLAAYVSVEAIVALVGHHEADHSIVGITWTAATLCMMLGLAFAKRRAGTALGNQVLLTEARVTLIDAGLAGATLAGLLLNAIAGLWWADPAAGLVIVFYAIREGIGALGEARALSPTAS